MQATEIALSKNAIRVLEARYLRRDTHRHIVETPRESTPGEMQRFQGMARGLSACLDCELDDESPNA